MVLVYKSLHRLAPLYLSDDCQLVTDVGRRHLRSADVHTCTVPRTQSRLAAIEVLGSPDHGCGTVCPLNCNSKTFASPSLGGYLRHFCSLGLGALWLLCFNGAGYKHSYLLTYLLTYKRRCFSCRNTQIRSVLPWGICSGVFRIPVHYGGGTESTGRKSTVRSNAEAPVGAWSGTEAEAFLPRDASAERGDATVSCPSVCDV